MTEGMFLLVPAEVPSGLRIVRFGIPCNTYNVEVLHGVGQSMHKEPIIEINVIMGEHGDLTGVLLLEKSVIDSAQPDATWTTVVERNRHERLEFRREKTQRLA